MKNVITIGDWRVATITNKELRALGAAPSTAKGLQDLGIPSMAATVPGNIELDLMREGIIPDIYFGTGSYETQKYENLHLYYYTSFDYEKRMGFDCELVFGGVDTAAEIYLDGELLGFVENMLHPHSFSLNEKTEGTHEILVHIIPATIYARRFEVPAMCFGLKYNQDAIQLRKPGYMFGWDIMPRIVSGGLWRPVELHYLPRARICDPYTYTDNLSDDNRRARLKTTFTVKTDEDFMTDFSVILEGRCKESSFRSEHKLFNASNRINTVVTDPELWWPKNYGEQNLYDVTITLLFKGEVCDRVSYRLGIRYLWLKRTSTAGDDGDFCFIVNGKRIFVMGTNWVPCDALPSRHDEYTIRNIEMANDLGCNMIRCWGGNAYPSKLLYDYCDEHGIMIWQDFSFACGHYPDDDRIAELTKQEVRAVVKEKRQHPSLALWAGDNECDVFVVPYWESSADDNRPPAFINPNFNRLTRDTIMRELRNHDATRPYLPSSPYLDEMAYRYGKPAEDHIWGPRDFFKGDYYLHPACHFASEIGYHGCPSPDSIRKFIPENSMPKNSIEEICDNPDWLIHAAGMVPTKEDNPYAYRLPLMISHVKRIFGSADGSLDDFARMSQISQAEAKKYFIESFRTEKWRKTGILWWNVADGWPQVSDAIVDWYGTKKLAYSYIKRSQQPLCLICSEPCDGVISLIAANDSRSDLCVSFKVTDLSDNTELASGEFTVCSDGKMTVATLPERKGGFYLIEWQSGSLSGKNHYVCHIGEGWTYPKYLECMKKAGFDKSFEGFSE